MQVVLIDVDPGFGTELTLFLPGARNILERAGVDWPNTIAPKGLGGTRRVLNVGGYSTIFVDQRGIVRGVGLHGEELERVVDGAMREWAQERLRERREAPAKEDR